MLPGHKPRKKAVLQRRPWVWERPPKARESAAFWALGKRKDQWILVLFGVLLSFWNQFAVKILGWGGVDQWFDGLMALLSDWRLEPRMTYLLKSA